ncbi:FAD:protein FMN transferase [Sphingosinicella microcystinivorans]|uniref:FAD:protein FMN transferase n=1 Tax=Sphingosinicella microcystinivorans TaxID=335406 RepID=A0AAD1D8D7_SPHMI|nr:FAD:protein FMN transferase [Sphingosinicella microcystinivorans]BBE35154.1 FAD:protein FMN transferase [Sphingosinicella microcystinivorans]
MGTRWSVRLVVTAPRKIADVGAGVQGALDGVVAEMSTWEAASDISRFNRAAVGAWQAMPPGFLTVLSTALRIAGESGGAFDPTVGAIVDAWGFGAAGPVASVPDTETTETLCRAGGWGRVECDTLLQRARRTGTLALDFSGIAKGFGADRVAAWLKSQGFRHFLVEVGGELVGEGVKPDGQPWWVDIEMPPGAALPPLRLALHGLSAATSGDYRRWFEADGQRFAHTIDPRSGRPAEGVASVTVLHPECMCADAYATAIAVLGAEEGLRFANRLGLAAHIISRDGGEAMNLAFTAMLD